MVSPTTIPTPVDQIASSVTVITGHELERDHIGTVPDALRTVPGLNVVQTGAGRRADRGVHARHQFQPRQGVHRRRRCRRSEHAERRLRLRPSAHRRRRAHRDAARPAKRPLRFGRDRRRHIDHHQEGRRPAESHEQPGSRLVRHLQPDGQPERLAGPLQLFVQRAAFAHHRQQSDAAQSAGAGRDVEQRQLRQPHLFDPARRRSHRQSRAQCRRPLYRRAKSCSPATISSTFRRRRRKRCGTRRSTTIRSSAAKRSWSLFDGKLKNIFGTSYTNQWSWNYDPNPDSFTPFGSVAPPTKNVGEKTKYDWRGEAKLLPGQTLVLGLEKETQKLRTDSTGDGRRRAVPDHTSTRATRPARSNCSRNFSSGSSWSSNVRYDDDESFGPHRTWRVAPAFIVPGHRDQAERQLRHRLQGADT